MTDTSFQGSMSLLRAIDADYRDRVRAIESAHEDEILPAREEFTRKRAAADLKRKRALEHEKKWRDEMIKRAGVQPVDADQLLAASKEKNDDARRGNLVVANSKRRCARAQAEVVEP